MLFSEQTRLKNTIPGINVVMPHYVVKALLKLQAEASFLLDRAAQAIRGERQEQKIGRNDPCPCGSGKKYKKCHGR